MLGRVRPQCRERFYQPGYTTYDASLGVSKEKWTATVYGQNLSNSDASTYTNTSQYIATTFGITSAMWAHVVTYTVIVTAAILLFEVLGAVYQRYLDMLVAPVFDRLTGTLAGAVVGAFEITVTLIVGVGLVRSTLPSGYSYPPAFLTAQTWFNNSLLAPHFYGMEPLTRSVATGDDSETRWFSIEP